MKKNMSPDTCPTAYVAPSCEEIRFASEGMLCDSDPSKGGIDPWRFNDNPMTF